MIAKVPFTEDMDRALVAAFNGQDRMMDVAARLGVSRSVLHRRQKTLGLMHRPWYGKRMPAFYKHVKIPEHCHPMVRRLFGLMIQQKVSFSEMERRTGIGRNAIWAWGETTSPLLINIEACFNVLDYTLIAKKRGWDE